MRKDKRRGRFLGPWTAYMAELQEERGLNNNDFAALLGETPNNTTQYMHGIMRPRIDKMGMWARRMDLSPREHARLVHLAALAHTPEVIQEELRDVTARLHKLEDMARRLLRAQGEEPSKHGL